MVWTVLKVPIILCVLYNFRVGFTPPRGQPRPEERDRYQDMSPFMRFMQTNNATKTSVFLVKAIPVLWGSLDILFILAYLLRSTTLGAAALHTICWAPGHPSISPGFFIGALTVVAAAHIRRMCYRELGAFFTFQLSIRDGHKLITTGPYAVVRHPGYTACTLLAAGITLCATSSGSWIMETRAMETIFGRLLAACWTAMTMYLVKVFSRYQQEDAILRKKFGTEWDAYAMRVPYAFIPGVF